MAIFLAIAIHLIAWFGLYLLLGFDLASYIKQIADYHNMASSNVADVGVHMARDGLVYLAATTTAGFLLGTTVAGLVMYGPLRFLATHKWIYDILAFGGKEGAVKVFVVTTTIENNKALMYKGHLQEFYLDSDGRFTYVVLKNVFKFFLLFDEDTPKTSHQTRIFQPAATAESRAWDYLMIDGSNIANILFDPSGDIGGTPAAARRLQEAIATHSAGAGAGAGDDRPGPVYSRGMRAP